MTARTTPAATARGACLLVVLLAGCASDRSAATPPVLDAGDDATLAQTDAGGADGAETSTPADAATDSSDAGSPAEGPPSCTALIGSCQARPGPQCFGGGLAIDGGCPTGEICCPSEGACNGTPCCVGCTCWGDGIACSVCAPSSVDSGCDPCAGTGAGCVTPCGNIACGPGCHCTEGDGGGVCACP